MSRVLLLGTLALGIAGCAGSEPRVQTVVKNFACPTSAPPALYELPARQSVIHPDAYRAERYELEGRHTAFSARYGAYVEAWAACPTED